MSYQAHTPVRARPVLAPVLAPATLPGASPSMAAALVCVARVTLDLRPNMKSMFAKSLAALRNKLDAGHDDLWDVLEWLAIPVLILYPQLAVLKWYRYGRGRTRLQSH